MRICSNILEEYLLAVSEVEARVIRRKEPIKESTPEYPPKFIRGPYTKRVVQKSQDADALDISRI